MSMGPAARPAIRAGVDREAARTERGTEFLDRSREAMQRGVDRIERLRAQSDGDRPAREPAPPEADLPDPD
jgi:hypothetical protein